MILNAIKYSYFLQKFETLDQTLERAVSQRACLFNTCSSRFQSIVELELILTGPCDLLDLITFDQS